MSDIGIKATGSTLTLWRGRDFRWSFECVDTEGFPLDIPEGRIYFEFQVGDDVIEWDFEIDGNTASIKVEHTAAEEIPSRTLWQLVFLPDGEVAGGDPIDYGRVQVIPR